MEVAIISIESEKQKDIDLSDDIQKAFAAAAIDDVIGLKELLKSVPVNSMDENGMTMLHHAAAGLCEDSVVLLLEHPEIDATIEDNFGRDASWLTFQVNGETPDATKIIDILDPHVYPMLFE